MGSWLNVAFVQTADLTRVEEELSRVVTEAGRALVQPAPRTPAELDPMQYGSGAEVARWGLAGFAGARGWTVVRTAPLELLLQDHAALLVKLCTRLRAPGFQYNLYDGDSHFLWEVDASGGSERSGFVASDPEKFWDDEPSDDRIDVQFHRTDAFSAADTSQRDFPDARVTGLVPHYRRPNKEVPKERRAEVERVHAELEARTERKRVRLVRWLADLGTKPVKDGPFETWSLHPAHVVRALAGDGDTFLPMEGVVDRAITQVFGGDRAAQCDNELVVTTLVPHAPLPVPGFVLYAE